MSADHSGEAGHKRKDSKPSDGQPQSVYTSLANNTPPEQHIPLNNSSIRSRTNKLNSRRKKREEELARKGFTEPVSIPAASRNSSGTYFPEDDLSPDPTPPTLPNENAEKYPAVIVFPRKKDNHSPVPENSGIIPPALPVVGMRRRDQSELAPIPIDQKSESQVIL
jgi:hypothetical protein